MGEFLNIEVTVVTFPRHRRKHGTKDDETWEKVVKLVVPGIIKMAVSNVDFVCSILFCTYLPPHISSYKFSANDL